jgi:hypothetical protein
MKPKIKRCKYAENYQEAPSIIRETAECSWVRTFTKFSATVYVSKDECRKCICFKEGRK